MRFGLRGSSTKTAKSSNASRQSSQSHSQKEAPPGVPPPILVPNRQILDEETLLALRHACALILKETGPSDEDYAVIVNQPDPLEVFRREQREIRDVREQASASQTSLGRFSGPRPARRDSKPVHAEPLAPARRASKPLPPPIQTNGLGHASKTERKSKPLLQAGADGHVYAATNARRGDSNYKPRKLSHDALQSSVRATTDSRARPLPTAYAENTKSSKHDSRSTSYTNDDMSRRDSKSTAHTSAGFYEGQPWGSRKDSRKHSLNSMPASGASVDPYAQRWTDQESMQYTTNAQGTSYGNPDYAVIPTLHAEKRRSLHRIEDRPLGQAEHPQASEQSVGREPSRTQSRASSIMDNIRDGIRDYVKPRPSANPSRMQSQPESRTHSRADSRASSRPPSRGSFSSSRSWLKGAANGLRRKGSWSSFRSNTADDDGDDHQRRNKKDKSLDLNRSLPPLPGLDQYKEPKKHIAQLMARKTVAEPEQEEQQPAPIVTENSSKPVNAPPKPPPRLASLQNGHPSPKNPEPAQAAPDSTLSPARSVRIPFTDESPPAERSSLPVIQPVEPGWLDMEVQRRIHGGLSPALSNDAVAAVVSTATSPGSRPDAEAAAERRREDDIRRIARRPVAQDRSQSLTSQVSHQRSLSALGGPRTAEPPMAPERSADRRAATSLGYYQAEQDAESSHRRNKTEATRGSSSLGRMQDLQDNAAEVGRISPMQEESKPPQVLQKQLDDAATVSGPIDQPAEVYTAAAAAAATDEEDMSAADKLPGRGRSAKPVQTSNSEQENSRRQQQQQQKAEEQQEQEQERAPQPLHERGSSFNNASTGAGREGLEHEREQDERAWRKTRELVDAATKNGESRVLELRLPVSEVPPKPPSKSPVYNEKPAKGRRVPIPAPVRVQPVVINRAERGAAAPAPKTAPLPSARTYSAAKQSFDSPHPPPPPPYANGRTSNRLTKAKRANKPAAVRVETQQQQRQSADDYEVLPDLSKHHHSPIHYQAPLLASQQRYGGDVQRKHSWLGSPTKRSPITATNGGSSYFNPKELLGGPDETKTTYAQLSPGGILRRNSMGGGGAGAGGPRQMAAGNSSAYGGDSSSSAAGYGYGYGYGHVAIGGSRSAYGGGGGGGGGSRYAASNAGGFDGSHSQSLGDQQSKKSLRNRLSRLLSRNNGNGTGGEGGGGGGASHARQYGHGHMQGRAPSNSNNNVQGQQQRQQHTLHDAAVTAAGIDGGGDVKVFVAGINGYD